jgi:hypothetical protein
MKIACVVTLFLFSTKLFAEIVNGFDLTNLQVEREKLYHAGPPRDSIPAIDSPQFEKGQNSKTIRDDDQILGLVVEGQAYAFPLHILNWHEIVNATHLSTHFLVSYCPLCGTGQAYYSAIGDNHLNFGVSGLLLNSDLVFYDRETESLWSQFDGRAISGELSGQRLKPLTQEHTRWDTWINQHPQSLVLSEQQGFARNYRDDPYKGYKNTQALFFKIAADIPEDYHTKEYVIGLTHKYGAKAYPFIELRKYGKEQFRDQLNGLDYIVHWDPKRSTAKITDTNGKTIRTTTAFWFAWYAFNPCTDVFTAEQ